MTTIRRKTTKQDIIDISIQLFGQKGVENVSMNDIASACDIRKASLYAHYKSREDIINACYKHSLQIYYDAMLDAEHKAFNDYYQSLKNMVFAILELHDKDIYMFRFLVINQYTQIQYSNVIDDNNIIALLANKILAGVQNKKIKIQEKDIDIITLSIAGIIIQQSVGIMFGRLNSSILEYKDIIWNIIYTILESKNLN